MLLAELVCVQRFSIRGKEHRGNGHPWDTGSKVASACQLGEGNAHNTSSLVPEVGLRV